MADQLETREFLVYGAKLAEQAERYDEMVEAMTKVALMDVKLTAEERILLSVGYTKLFAFRRVSLRILSAIKQAEESQGNQLKVEQIRVYARKVEAEILKICEELKSVLTDHVIPSITSGDTLLEDHVFYHKIMGDAHRYCAEFKTGDVKAEFANQSLDEYTRANAIAEGLLLPSTNAFRLSVALSLSVLYYEILDLKEIACDVARTAFNAAMGEIEDLKEEDSKESLNTMQFLKDNLTIWNTVPQHEIDEAVRAAGFNIAGEINGAGA